MKAIILKTLTMLTILFGAMSCSKDDNNDIDLDNDTGCNNCFVYANGGNPRTVQLSSVQYKPDGEDMEITFASNGSNEKITIYLENRDGATIGEIPTGTFDYNSSPVFFRAVMHTEEDGDNSYGIRNAGWKLVITKDGNNYKFNFNFISGVGQTNGNFAGKVSRQ